jgi:hypothetical protein
MVNLSGNAESIILWDYWRSLKSCNTHKVFFLVLKVIDLAVCLSLLNTVSWINIFLAQIENI